MGKIHNVRKVLLQFIKISVLLDAGPKSVVALLKNLEKHFFQFDLKK